MRLYHASDRVIKEPDVNRGRRNADFGQGFYLSPDREFSVRWAGLHPGRPEDGEGRVTAELDRS